MGNNFLSEHVIAFVMSDEYKALQESPKVRAWLDDVSKRVKAEMDRMETENPMVFAAYK